jgi:hypothetical protein
MAGSHSQGRVSTHQAETVLDFDTAIDDIVRAAAEELDKYVQLVQVARQLGICETSITDMVKRAGYNLKMIRGNGKQQSYHILKTDALKFAREYFSS